MDCESQLQLQQQYRITEFGRSVEFPRIPFNFAETWKFRGNGQISRLGSKFRGPYSSYTPVVLNRTVWITFLPIMKIKSNATDKDLLWRFSLYQRPSSEEELVPFSSDEGL